MKTYKNLYNTYISKENVKLAIINAVKKKKKKDKKTVVLNINNKKQRVTLKEISENPDKYVETFREYALNYHGEIHQYVEIYDGVSHKLRKIVVPDFKEQVVHHMVMNILKPIFMKGMYEHTNASIPNRGAHRGAKYIKKWIKKGKNIKYCVKADIRKFFDSIDQNILIEKLGRIIKDDRLMEVIVYIVRSVPFGLPLGFYTSHWFADFLLRDIDHGLKEQQHVPHYARYMDDMGMFFGNKKLAHQAVEYLKNQLKQLGLRLKDNWQVFRFHYLSRKEKKKNGQPKDCGRPLDFMGFKFYRNRTTLRKSTLRSIQRKANKIYKKGMATIHDARQMISYLGKLKATDVYDYYINHIKELVDLGKLKRKISKNDIERRLATA